MTTRTRLWLTILIIMAVVSGAIIALHVGYRTWPPQFNAELQDLDLTGQEGMFDSHYYTYHSNAEQSQLLRSDGTIVKQGKYYEILAVEDLLFITSHPADDFYQPIQLEQFIDGALVPFTLPTDFTSLNIDIQPSPDQQYWLIHGFLPESWYLYEPAKQTLSPNLTKLLPPEYFNPQALAEQADQIEIQWLDGEHHELYINIYKVSVNFNLVKRYSYNASTQQLVELDVETSPNRMPYFNPANNLPLDLIPLYVPCNVGLRKSVIAELWSQDYRCHTVQITPSLSVTVTHPLVGKQKLLVVDHATGKSTTVSSWFAVRGLNEVNLQPLGDSNKVVVVANDRVGILDPQTKQFAEILQLTFRARVANNGNYSLRLLPR